MFPAQPVWKGLMFAGFLSVSGVDFHRNIIVTSRYMHIHVIICNNYYHHYSLQYYATVCKNVNGIYY